MLASFKTPCKKYTRPRKGERHLAVRDDHLSVFVPHGGAGQRRPDSLTQVMDG